MYNIIIVDDHKIFIDGLLSIFEGEKEYNVVFASDNGKNVLQFLDTTNTYKKIDLIISDISMPHMDGILLNKHIKENYPNINVLIVSMHTDLNIIDQVIKYDVDGYISKNTGKEEFLKAIKTIINGTKYFPKKIRENYFNEIVTKNVSPLTLLSNREKEVLKLIALEYTTKEIADKLFLSTHTIESYRKVLISKLNVRNMAGLVRYAIKLGLIT